jgi:sporulation protein YlmC with PRC-barrel domain
MPTASGHTTAIRAKKAIGTPVYNASGDKIGIVEDIVLDKLSNNIMYAVVGFGGFLNIGEKYHPIPWAQLDYDETKGGYVVPYAKKDLEAAPAGSLDELTAEDGAMAYREQAFSHYNAPRYW